MAMSRLKMALSRLPFLCAGTYCTGCEQSNTGSERTRRGADQDPNGYEQAYMALNGSQQSMQAHNGSEQAHDDDGFERSQNGS